MSIIISPGVKIIIPCLGPKYQRGSILLSAFGVPASGGVPADVIDFLGGSRQTGGDPATVVFSMADTGNHSALTGPSSSQWETENNPTPVDTYHVKWEDHDTFSNPGTTPFAKSTWTLLSGAGPFVWSHTESSPDISTRGMKIFISNDGGSTDEANADVSITADATP